MSKGLKNLFEYQKFEQNSHLADMIRDTESRYDMTELSDNDLEMVTAARGSHSEHRFVDAKAIITSASISLQLDQDHNNKRH